MRTILKPCRQRQGQTSRRPPTTAHALKHARPLSAALRDRGAVVTGIHASAGMLALARRRLGDDVALHVVDLNDRLPFADGAFDDVVASLVLHYLED
jgi:SAM-dependent methyltransferase